MNQGNLYQVLKNKICARIYDGSYPDGESLPPERQLAESFSMSRVTVRKALDILVKEGMIESVQGRGNIVRLRQTGYQGSMDIIALVAPAQNPFFSTFIDYFQQNAQVYDSLVLFKQNPKKTKIEDTLFQLYQKNIRNAVIWLEDLTLDIEYLRRLRGLGMNLVFFDIAVETSYADCVYSDNADAIKQLIESLLQHKKSEIHYIGWDNRQLTSAREREAFFSKSLNSEQKSDIAWSEKSGLRQQMEDLIHRLSAEKMPNAFLCGDGEIGMALKRTLLAFGMQEVVVATVDDFPESEALELTVYRQNFAKLAEQVYACLQIQNQHPKKWKAAIYKIQGELIERYGFE